MIHLHRNAWPSLVIQLIVLVYFFIIGMDRSKFSVKQSNRYCQNEMRRDNVRCCEKYFDELDRDFIEISWDKDQFCKSYKSSKSSDDINYNQDHCCGSIEHPINSDEYSKLSTNEPKFSLLKRIKLHNSVEGRVLDLSLDGIDNDPLVLAELIDSGFMVDQDIVKTVQFLHLDDTVVPSLKARHVETTSSPGSLVPLNITVNRINTLQTRTLNELEAQFSSGDFQYPTDEIVSNELKDFQIKSEKHNSVTNVKPSEESKYYTYQLELLPSRHCTSTHFQLRGSNIPKWFPGMFTCLPDDTKVRLARTPSTIFYGGWAAMQP